VVAWLRGLSDGLDRIARWALVPIGIGFIVIVFLGVLTRYVFQTPIISSIELARLGFVWAAFLGAAVCFKAERHTQFLFLLDRLHGRPQAALRSAIDALAVGFFLFLSWEGVRMVDAVQATYFPALGWSQLWLYLPLPITAGLMLVHAAAFLARDLGSLTGGERMR
jgi:TRAP-type C4-dicarboxylate transport system permease small subunit